jgi:Flp pilus assembly protein TadD
MAKKKKKKPPIRRPRGRPVLSGKLEAQLDKAENLIRRKQWAEANDLLATLQQQHPRQPDVLALRLELAVQTHDFRTHQAVCRRLIELRPDDAELHMLLAGSYLATERPALALRTFQDFLKRWPNHPDAAEARRIIADVEPNFRQLLASIGLDGADALQLGAWHEEIQVHLEWGEFAEVRRVAERLLTARPQFVPALNNLAESFAQEADYAQAAQTARRVLALGANNVHALANLTRYLYLSGQASEAEETAARLRTLTPSRSDEWVKVVQTLSCLGDDAGVEEMARRARESGKLSETDMAAYAEHLVGVAAYRQGREADARRHWKTALRHRPGFDLAQANLDDLRQPADKRHAAWPFEIDRWLPRNLQEALAQQLKRSEGAKRDRSAAKRAVDFLRKHPHVEKLLPILLDRGDPAGRTWALKLAQLAGTPALHAALRDFALSQRGPDEQRLEASRAAQEADVFPSGLVRMWMGGEWREVLLLSFEITEEPQRKHSPEVEELAYQAHEALFAEEGGRAESFLRRALELEPDKPDLLNNLAAAYMLQGRIDEGEQLIRQIHARFPDYFFGTIGAARLAVNAGQLDEATALLRPLLERKKFHTSEFTALAMAEIQLQLARGEREGARSWLQLWENTVPDHPDLPTWRSRVNSRSIWQRLLQR